MIRNNDTIIITKEDILEAQDQPLPALYLQEKIIDMMQDILSYHIKKTTEEALKDCLEGLKTGKYKLIETDDYIREYNRLHRKESDNND